MAPGVVILDHPLEVIVSRQAVGRLRSRVGRKLSGYPDELLLAVVAVGVGGMAADHGGQGEDCEISLEEGQIL